MQIGKGNARVLCLSSQLCIACIVRTMKSPRRKAATKATDSQPAAERTHPAARESGPAQSNSAADANSNGKAKRGKPFEKGDPRINRTIPGPGRPKDRFKKWCRKLVMDKRTKRSVRQILRDKDHPAYKAMWSEIAAHGFGKPDAHVDLKASVSLETLVAQANEEDDA